MNSSSSARTITGISSIPRISACAEGTSRATGAPLLTPGNEPSHHIAYLYTIAGHPEKTAEVVRDVFDLLYKPTPDGLCGNDDCGQMSAWYMFSAFGFYPVNPISGTYVFGAPQLHEATLHLPGGMTFTIKADGLSETAKYVKSVSLNGEAIDLKTLTYDQIMAGGELVYQMTDAI